MAKVSVIGAGSWGTDSREAENGRNRCNRCRKLGNSAGTALI